MHKIDIVVGANYGDEGKGATTHRLVKENNAAGLRTTVVRFNGGSQAGHTVQLENGYRRVFSSLGSGTLAGADTYLSRYFLFDPLAFEAEFQDYFNSVGPNGKKYNFPIVSVDSSASVVTPFDVAHNQLLEMSRGDKRHGSVGKGIGATMYRRHDGINLSVLDLTKSEYVVKNCMDKVLRYYKQKSPFIASLSPSEIDELCGKFLKTVEFMSGHIRICPGLPNQEGQAYVFEGAQGLLLSMFDKEHYPHVTYSDTSANNALAIVSEELIESDRLPVNIHYCTRPYLTRHGAGPAHAAYSPLFEDDWNIQDETNVPHLFQGTMKFYELDFDKLKARVQERKEVTNHLSVTCMDQLVNKDREPDLKLALFNVVKHPEEVTFFNGLMG